MFVITNGYVWLMNPSHFTAWKGDATKFEDREHAERVLRNAQAWFIPPLEVRLYEQS